MSDGLEESLLSEEEFKEYEKLMAEEDAYQNFRGFIKHTMPSYEFNWHHEVMIEILQSLEHTTDRRVMIFLPPRFGKSELVSRRFPAWLLGR